jgi:hypothetical protein
VLLFTSALVGACEHPTVCTAEFVYGLTVTVSDSATTVPLVDGTVVVVRDGAFVDSVRATVGNNFISAGERAGVYSVLAHHAGYRDWIASGVRVTRGSCHVVPVGLTARLQRLTSLPLLTR